MTGTRSSDTGAAGFWLTLGVETGPLAASHEWRGGTIGGKHRMMEEDEECTVRFLRHRAVFSKCREEP